MSIPDYQSIMLPLLTILRDGNLHDTRELRSRLVQTFSVTDEELRETLPSGSAPLFNNRVGWATTYLKQARLIEAPKRGTYRITARGVEALGQAPERIDVNFLTQFEEFRAFRTRPDSKGQDAATQSGNAEEAHADTAPNGATPEESLEEAYRNLRREVEAELLQQVMSASPAFFERLVVELLVKMGYGGSLKDAGRAIGQTGDGGIDGMIKEDRLGLDAIYIQAKRWKNTVGRPEIQAFAGSLEGERARKGVFITTSIYSKEAQDYVGRIDKRIILIDGQQLAAFLFDFGVGVTRQASYEVKRVDSDYFSEQ